MEETQTFGGRTGIDTGNNGNTGIFKYEEKAMVVCHMNQAGEVYWFPMSCGIEMGTRLVIEEHSRDGVSVTVGTNLPGRIPVNYVAQVKDCAVHIQDSGKETTLGIYNADENKRRETLGFLEELFSG